MQSGHNGKTKEEPVKANTVSVMHSTMGTASSNLCQYRVSGKEIGYEQAIQKQLRTRTNVTLQNEACSATQDQSQYQAQHPSVQVARPAS